MKSKAISATQLVRHGIQIAAFLLFPSLFIATLSSIGDIVTALVTGSFSAAALASQLATVLVVLLVTALFGRFFCGYLCAFGAMQDLVAWISHKVRGNGPRVPEGVDEALKYGKYVVLAAIVVFVWVLQLPVDSSLSPWGVFGMLISGNLSVMSSAIFTVGFVVLLVIVAGAFFIDRFFCRYLCPLGAIFVPISKARLFKIRRRRATCVNCALCTARCSMGIRVHDRAVVDSGECVNCMECLEACRFDSLAANPSPAVAGAAASAAICGLVTVGNIGASALAADAAVGGQSVSTAVAEQASGEYTDGTYTGTGSGYRGETDVQVTVENGYITDITVLSYADDDEFFSKAESGVIQEILSSQSTDVDTVSGATFSSEGIIEAVADALGVDTSTSSSATTTADESADSSTETTTSDSSDSSTTTSDELDLSSIADGVYQGSGTGLRGTTTVSVTVESGQITDITVDSYEDDEQYFTRASSTIISEILSAQSLDVDTVSGATYSSNGILEAVADALGVSYEATTPQPTGGHGGR